MRCTEQHADITYNIQASTVQDWYRNEQHTIWIKLPFAFTNLIQSLLKAFTPTITQIKGLAFRGDEKRFIQKTCKHE